MNHKMLHHASKNTPLSFPYHAIIVLANLLDKNHNLNDFSRSRMDAAIGAFRAKEALFIVTTGWDYHGDYAVPIAVTMRDYAIKQHHVSPEAIITDINARDTVGDAVFTKRNIILPKALKKLLIITSEYHVERSREIFTFIYGPNYSIEVRGVANVVGNEVAETEQQSLQAFRTTFEDITPGDYEAIWERLRHRHPFYNGDIYPQI